jgi:hypothetical protein
MSNTNGTEVARISADGQLFDEQGNLVPLKPTKAVFGGILGFASMTVTGLLGIYTDSVPLTILGIVIGSAATVLGIFLPANKLK